MGRLWRMIKGFWLRLIGAAEEATPVTILHAEIAEFQKANAQFNENLAKQAGLIERQKSQVAVQEKNVEILRARGAAAYGAGEMGRAGEFALKHKDAKRELNENKAQLAQAEELFKNLTRQRDIFVKAARERIESAKSKISKAEMVEAQAKLTEMASNVTFSHDGSGLNALNEKLDERIANAQGKVIVAQGQVNANASEWNVTHEEQLALERQALADFEREMGIVPKSPDLTAPKASPVRELGPEEEALQEFVNAKQ